MDEPRTAEFSLCDVHDDPLALPMGIIAAFSAETAQDIGAGISAYLRGLSEQLYALFGTGYLGYTAARQWGKAKGVEGR